MPGSLLRDRTPGVPWAPTSLRQKNLVLDSLGLAIADTHLVLQAIPAGRAQESVLQVVFLSSDPMKRLQRCVSNWAGQITTPQQPCFSHAFPFISGSFPLFCNTQGGSIQISGVRRFPAPILVYIFCKSPELLSISRMTLLAATAAEHTVHTLPD